jgi:SIR2-like domain
MGQNKASEIDNSSLLNWYRGQFCEMIGQPGAHLMVIGYSFRDEHINQIIVQAAQKGNEAFHS